MGVVVRRLGHAMEVVERSSSDSLEQVEVMEALTGACHGGVKRSSSATLEKVEVAENVNKT